MRRAIPVFAGLFLVATSVAALGQWVKPTTFAARWAVPEAPQSAKGDRLAMPQSALPREIKAVEMIGMDSMAVTYRDESGAILFSNNPKSGTTIIAKGVVLPDVTIRNAPAAPKAAPTVQKSGPTRESDRQPEVPAKRKLPVACEPSFSPVAAPRLSDISGRCFVEAAAPRKYAEAAPLAR